MFLSGINTTVTYQQSLKKKVYNKHRALRNYERNKAKMNKRGNFDPPMAENRF